MIVICNYITFCLPKQEPFFTGDRSKSVGALRVLHLHQIGAGVNKFNPSRLNRVPVGRD